MRIRGSHIATFVLILVGMLVVVILWRDRAMRGDDIDTAVEDARVPAVTEDPDNVPIIELESYEVNLGTVPNEGFYFGEVKIYNKGKAPLNIKDVQTTCACTVGGVKSEYNPIPPNGEGILTIRIDPRRIPGFNSRKTLTIQSNDAIHPNVQLVVEVDVEPEYELEPAELDMGAMAKGDGTTATMIVRQLREKPLNITEVKEHLPEEMPQDEPYLEFSFELLPEDQWTNPGKQEYVITARQGELIPAGPFERRFRMTSDVNRAEQYIPIRGRVTTPYHVDMGGRGVLFLGASQTTGRAEGTVTVTSDQTFEVIQLTSDPSRLVVEAPVQGPTKSVEFRVTLGPGMPSGQFIEFFYFTLRMDGKEYRERIPVRGLAP